MQMFWEDEGDQYTFLVNTEIWDSRATIVFNCLACGAMARVRIQPPNSWVTKTFPGRRNIFAQVLNLAGLTPIRVSCLCHRCARKLDPRLVLRAGDEQRLAKALRRHRLSFDATLKDDLDAFRRDLVERARKNLPSITAAMIEGSIPSRQVFQQFFGLDQAPPRQRKRANQAWDSMCRLRKAKRDGADRTVVEELQQEAEQQNHRIMTAAIERFVDGSGAAPVWDESVSQAYDSYITRWQAWEETLDPAIRLVVVPKVSVVGPVTRVKQITWRLPSIWEILRRALPVSHVELRGVAHVSVDSVQVPPGTTWMLGADEAMAKHGWIKKLTSSAEM